MNRQLSPQLEAQKVGVDHITIDGIPIDRIYLLGDYRYEAAGCGMHVQLRSRKATLTHQTETVVDVEVDPRPSNYYIG